MGKVTVRHANRPDGDLIEIPGLGLFPNNKTTEIEGDEDYESINPPQVVESDTSRDELYAKAQELNIEGRSKMSKEELATAVEAALTAPPASEPDDDDEEDQ
jgi:hypothetical protein